MSIVFKPVVITPSFPAPDRPAKTFHVSRKTDIDYLFFYTDRLPKEADKLAKSLSQANIEQAWLSIMGYGYRPHDPNDWAFGNYVAAVLRERQYQDAKHGTIHDRPKCPAGWYYIMRHEFNEAVTAWNKNHDNRASLGELLQVAAVALAGYEQMTHRMIKPDLLPNVVENSVKSAYAVFDDNTVRGSYSNLLLRVEGLLDSVKCHLLSSDETADFINYLLAVIGACGLTITLFTPIPVERPECDPLQVGGNVF